MNSRSQNSRTQISRTVGVSALLALGLFSGPALAQRTVNLGFSGAITGPTSDAGAPYSAGVTDYCKYANDKNLVPGYRFNCDVRDDAYDNAKTQRNLEDFADSTKILGYMGYSTGGSLQVKSLLQEIGIAMMPASLHIGLIDSPNNQYVFLPISSYSEQLVTLVEYVGRTNKNAKIALVVNPSPFGRLPAEDAKKAAAALKLDVVATDEVGANNLDNTALLKRYEALGVTHVLHQNTAGPVSNILKDAKRLGLDRKFTQLGAHFTGGEDLIALAGDAADGFLWATGFWLVEDANQPGMKLIREIGASARRPEATVRSVNYTAGANVAAIFVEATRRAVARRNVTARGLYEAIIGMNGPNAYSSGFTLTPMDFTRSEHTGSEGIRVTQVRGGKFVPVGGVTTSALFRRLRGSGAR